MTKTPQELELMAESGRLLASVFTWLGGLTLAGMSTMEVNDRVEAFIVEELKARPASKGQYGYGFVLNCSINAVVCHGVPSTTEILKAGDIVNLDITLEKNGFIADSSKTYLIGNVAAPARRLVRTTYEALWKGIRAVRPGATLGDIGFAIERHAARAGYSIVRDYCGHGIGSEFHEEPQILHYRNGGKLELKPGMCFTIEPMVNSKKYHCKVNPKDGWTVTTKDGGDSAQWEHTLLVTEDGCEVLTLRPDDTIDRVIKHS